MCLYKPCINQGGSEWDWFNSVYRILWKIEMSNCEISYSDSQVF